MWWEEFTCGRLTLGSLSFWFNFIFDVVSRHNMAYLYLFCDVSFGKSHLLYLFIYDDRPRLSLDWISFIFLTKGLLVINLTHLCSSIKVLWFNILVQLFCWENEELWCKKYGYSAVVKYGNYLNKRKLSMYRCSLCQMAYLFGEYLYRKALLG